MQRVNDVTKWYKECCRQIPSVPWKTQFLPFQVKILEEENNIYNLCIVHGCFGGCTTAKGSFFKQLPFLVDHYKNDYAKPGN